MTPSRIMLPDGRVVGLLDRMEPRRDGFRASFTPGPDYEIIREDLEFYSDIVHSNALSLLDDATHRVERHGLLWSGEPESRTAIRDLLLDKGWVFFRTYQ